MHCAVTLIRALSMSESAASAKLTVWPASIDLKSPHVVEIRALRSAAFIASHVEDAAAALEEGPSGAAAASGDEAERVLPDVFFLSIVLLQSAAVGTRTRRQRTYAEVDATENVDLISSEAIHTTMLRDADELRARRGAPRLRLMLGFVWRCDMDSVRTANVFSLGWLREAPRTALRARYDALTAATRAEARAFGDTVAAHCASHVAVIAVGDARRPNDAPLRYAALGASFDVAFAPTSLVRKVLEVGWQTRPCIMPSPDIDASVRRPLFSVAQRLLAQLLATPDAPLGATYRAFLPLMPPLVSLPVGSEHTPLLAVLIQLRRTDDLRTLLSQHARRPDLRASLLADLVPLSGIDGDVLASRYTAFNALGYALRLSDTDNADAIAIVGVLLDAGAPLWPVCTLRSAATSPSWRRHALALAFAVEARAPSSRLLARLLAVPPSSSSSSSLPPLATVQSWATRLPLDTDRQALLSWRHTAAVVTE